MKSVIKRDLKKKKQIRSIKGEPGIFFLCVFLLFFFLIPHFDAYGQSFDQISQGIKKLKDLKDKIKDRVDDVKTAVENRNDTSSHEAIMPTYPVKNLGTETYEDVETQPSNMDLQDPENVHTEVEYYPDLGYYIIHTKVGDVDVTTPYLMYDDEYKNYSEQQFMHKYWQEKISEVPHDNEKKFDITDMKFNIGAADKVFGPGGVQLKIQGSADLKFAFKHQYIKNPSLSEKSRNNNIFDFDEKIQVNVNAKVGDKINFNFNYNTEASFLQDQQNLKLSYQGKEDDIIQSIEAGNVTMDLNSNLIKGTKALFGIKTNIKLGKLKIQAVVSQQKSQSQTVTSEGGAQTTKFEIGIDSYDENRHFFLNYFFRDLYERAMTSLPYVASGVTINKIEVWVTNRNSNYDDARNILAFVDLGENDQKHIFNDNWTTNVNNAICPNNRANTLYDDITNLAGIRSIHQAGTALQNYKNLEGGEDFEKVESARRLSTSEYTLNASLGYISLKTNLSQDEVVAVAYEYTYAGQVFQVGEFSTDNSENLKSPNCLVMKLLKSTNTSPNKKNKGTWDLMMKNIYWIGATSISSDKFELYIQYKNDSVGTLMQYLPEGLCKGKQLLRVMNLDKLDTKNNTRPDGKFDYVENYTVLSNTGRIIFPVLEPFGKHLADAIGDKTIANKYVFQELYDSTLTIAQEYTEKNKFRITGKYKGSSGNEIRLGAMNVPRGSVKVTAGGATLVENVDYTVDYIQGTVSIINESITASGTDVKVELENQSISSLQRKSLLGLRLEYEFNKNLILGGSVMHLRERPLTTKVAAGSEPIANTIWGLNIAWRTDMQWLSNAIDRIPWITAEQPSSLQINAEFAHLIPGHTKDVGKAGTSYIDDFESTISAIDIHYPSYWFLASTPSNPSSPQTFASKDAQLSNNVEYNSHRALFNWYTVDPIFGVPQQNTPAYIKNNPDMMSDHRTRVVYSQELYPQRELQPNEDSRLTILNLSFYPQERGPYNISADRFGPDGKLLDPKNNWGGMMRKIDNTDFEKSNIEYIEFWLLDPIHTNPNGYEGDLYINLGDISEDILRDGKKSFEHGLPTSTSITTQTDTTIWGIVPRTTSTTVAFSNETGARALQDVGLNGLSTENEFLFTYQGKRPYADFVQNLRTKIDQNVLATWENDPFSPINDPAGDNFHYYRGSDYDRQELSILERYKRYNGTEGNSQDIEQRNETYATSATLQPDMEDINADNTLNEYEKYYQYHVSLRPQDLDVGKQNIVEKLNTPVKLRNNITENVTWYQFKIPIRGDSVQKIGSIRNFKSIRFMRLYMTGCEQETHLRMASLNLVRGSWRQYTKALHPVDKVPTTEASVEVQAVSIEQNNHRIPINYILPPDVSRQTDPGQAQQIPQDEQSLALTIKNLSPYDAKAVYKNIYYDLRNYKKLQMFVHAEELVEDPTLNDGDITCFIRIGSDFTYNYYEYEIPLKITPEGVYSDNNVDDRWTVWPRDNYFDFPLSLFTDAKKARNQARRAGTPNVSISTPYAIYDVDNGKPQNKITVMGSPTLQEIECIMIGIRNNSNHVTGANIWVNELRLSEFNEDGGVAAQANVALAISDIAKVNFASNIETAGYGSIENTLLDRNMENNYQFSISAAMEVGRLLPEKAKFQIPAYVCYTKNTSSPKYDPYDSDVELSETLNTYNTKTQKDSLKDLCNTTQQSLNFSVTNMKLNFKSKKHDMFYDPANFSISASYNKQKFKNPEMEKEITTEQKGSFNYAFAFNPKPWEPFKKIKKLDKVKILNEFNIYYLPQSWAFVTNMHRTYSHSKIRDLTESANDMELLFAKDFTWDRQVDFKYNLTKNMKFSLQTAHNAIIDEGYYPLEIIKDYHFTNDYYEAWKDTIQRSLARWGKPYTYQQVFTASWNVPLNRIPYMEAISLNASYNANYNWSRTVVSSSSQSELGNTITSTRSWQADVGINFETLYGKSKYWRENTQRYNGRQYNKNNKPKSYSETLDVQKGKPVTINHNLGSTSLTVLITDSTGKKASVGYKMDGRTKIIINPRKDYSKLNVAISIRNSNQREALQIVGDMATFLGTMLRKIQVTYRNTHSLSLAGFIPEPKFMGQSRVNATNAPGLAFTFGFIPKNFVEKAKNNGWLSGDTLVVQPALEAKTTDLDIRINLEPLPGLKIQLNGKRYTASSNSIIYSYDQIQENLTGSFNITQVAIGSIFDKIGSQKQNFQNDTYEKFLTNINIMQERVQQRYNNLPFPNAGFLSATNLPGKTYNTKEYAKVENNSADVIVPAFLAAYTGKNINKMKFSPILSILDILPNWSVTFDGIGRLPWFKDVFKSIVLTHAYTCQYAISSYNSYSTWIGANGNDKTLGFVRDVTTNKPSPSSAYDITGVTLSESFSPLIGLNIALKNSLSLKAEYRKQRSLSLNVTAVQLAESHSDEFIIGTGYTVKNLNFIRKNKFGAQKKVSNDLKLTLDIGYKNIKTLLRKMQEGLTQASNGNKVFSLKFTADYVLSQKINLQLFYDHESTTPLISTAYPIQTDNVGINIKLMLSR